MRTKVIAVAVVAGLLGLGGVAFAATGNETPESSTPSVAASTPAGTITAAQAEQIARDRIGGGDVEEVEREEEHGRSVWKVELVHNGDEVRVDVDTTSGEVLRVTNDGRDDDRRDDDDRNDNDGDDDDTDDTDGGRDDDDRNDDRDDN